MSLWSPVRARGKGIGDWLRGHPWDVAGLLGLLGYALPSFSYPHGRDQGIHWYVAQRLLDGELPYASATSTKGPLTFAIYSGFVAIFGEGMWVVRLIDLCFLLATALLAVSFRARVMSPEGPRPSPPARDGELGAAAILAGGFHYTFFDFSDTGHPELWLGCLMLASGWLVVRAPDFQVSPQRAFGAGLLACGAVAIKHVGVVSGVLVGGAIVLLGFRQSIATAARNALSYTLAVGLLLGSVLAAFWVGGAFDELWELMVQLILRYATQPMAKLAGLPPWLGADQGRAALVVASAVGVSGLALTHASGSRREKVVGAMVGALFLAGALTVVIQRRALRSSTFNYYWVLLVPFFVTTTAWGLRRLLAGRGKTQLVVSVGLVAAAFLFAPRGSHVESWSYRAEWASYVDYARGARTWAIHHRDHRNGALDDHVHLSAVAERLRARMEPGDTLCIDGFVTPLYSMTGMRCPSRIISGDFVGFFPPWEEELDEVLRTDPPDIFVTFGGRPRIEQLQGGSHDWAIEDIRFPDGAWYVVMERGGAAPVRTRGSKPNPLRR